MQRDHDNHRRQRRRASPEENKEPSDSIFYWISKDSEKSIHYKRNLIQLSRDLVHNRWYDTFNFYFSKPINEILAGVPLPHVVAYKDYLYYDDETEYLKRYYKRDEVKTRMENIADFYFTLTEGVTRTTLPLHEQNSIILKRNDKLNKLLLSKLQNFAGGPQPQNDAQRLTQEPNNLRPSKEDARLSNKKEEEKVEEEFPRLSDNVNVVQAKSINLAEPAEHSFQLILDKGDEDEDLEKSFDSIGHDIFNPNISMEDNVRDYLTKSMEKKGTSNFNRRRDLKAGDAFLEPPHPDKRLNNPVPAVQTRSIRAPQIAAADLDSSSSSSVKSLEKPLEKSPDSNKIEAREFSDEKNQRQNHLLPDNVSFSKREPSPSSNSQHSESKNLGLKSQSFTREGNPPFAVSNVEVNGSQRSDIIVQNMKNTMRDDIKQTEQETSTTRIQIEDTSRDMKYHPVITISNIQINQIAPPNGHKKEEHQLQQQDNYGPVNYQSQPPKKVTQPEYKQQSEYRGPPIETQFRPAETIFTEDSIEREVRPIAAPATSSDYVKDMMRKYYRVTDAELSHQVNERFKESSILAKLAGLKKNNNTQVQPASRDMYVNTNIRSTLIKDAPRQHTKGRINTDATVYQSIQSFRANHSPQNSITVQAGANTTRQPTSPTGNRRSYNRVKSNDGILLTQESSTSTSNIPTARRSPENTRSIGEFLANGDMVQTLNKGYDAVRLLQQKKAEYKHHNKSKSTSNYIFHATNLKASQASNRAQDSLPSTKAPSTHTQPPSASHKPDLRLDFASLNQGTKFESAQGFWSCRSGKSDHLDNVFSAKTPGHERTSSQVYKDDYLRQKYRQLEEAKVVSSTTRANYTNARPLGINLNLNKKSNVSKPTSFNSETNGAIGRVGEKRVTGNSRTGSISYPVKQFTNRKIGK